MRRGDTLVVTRMDRLARKGRRPSIDPAEIRRLQEDGLGATEIAKRLGIGRASVYRVLNPA
jgi:DNA invertase Pin-like site-specific DNA recombinase